MNLVTDKYYAEDQGSPCFLSFFSSISIFDTFCSVGSSDIISVKSKIKYFLTVGELPSFVSTHRKGTKSICRYGE